MSNYHHNKIDKLDDFRNPPTIINARSATRKHIHGYVIYFTNVE